MPNQLQSNNTRFARKRKCTLNFINETVVLVTPCRTHCAQVLRPNFKKWYGTGFWPTIFWLCQNIIITLTYREGAVVWRGESAISKNAALYQLRVSAAQMTFELIQRSEQHIDSIFWIPILCKVIEHCFYVDKQTNLKNFYLKTKERKTFVHELSFG